MAKNNDLDNENGNESGESVGSKVGTILIIVLIVIVWLAIFALLVKMDVGGMGTKLRPLIKNVPVLNLILPEAPEELMDPYKSYPYKNMDEAIEVIKKLEVQADSLMESNEEYQKKILELQSEIARLKLFEDDQKAFEERVKRFDVNVVYNSQAPEIEEYKKYYEEINPETAEEIYRQVLEQLQVEANITAKADLLRQMKPANAAAALQEMTADLEYTCKVLLAMKSSEATAILDKMDALFVARIIQTMHDMDDAYANRVQNNLLQNN
ncbi:MAG: hypothetical protein MJ131_00090 [Lachnospiraceae bacterium]|nr:hypothetical protein [Lachnospiraceae bacterium]